MDPDPDPGGPKTYGPDGSGFGFGSTTLVTGDDIMTFCIAFFLLLGKGDESNRTNI
jgi:hypothetical protein